MLGGFFFFKKKDWFGLVWAHLGSIVPLVTMMIDEVCNGKEGLLSLLKVRQGSPIVLLEEVGGISLLLRKSIPVEMKGLEGG